MCSTEEATTEATTMELTTMEVTTPEPTDVPTQDTTSTDDGTTDMTTAGGPLITDGDSTTPTTNRGTTSNPDATTAQPIGAGGGGSNVATIAIAVVVVLVVVIALVAILMIVLLQLRRRSKAGIYALRYYVFLDSLRTENKSGSKVEDEANTEVPLYDVIKTESGEGRDVTEGYIHDQFGKIDMCTSFGLPH